MQEAGTFMALNYNEEIFNAETGEITIRPYTAEEIAKLEANKIAAQNEADAKAADRAVKDAARQAVLDKLGLSADEVAALLG